MKDDKFLPYAVILGVVAIVAIVTLFMGKGMEGNTVREWKIYTGGEQYPCIDTDPTNDFYTAGDVTLDSYRYPDSCDEDNVGLLWQFYCPTSNTVKLLTYQCPKGCLNGACLK